MLDEIQILNISVAILQSWILLDVMFATIFELHM